MELETLHEAVERSSRANALEVIPVPVEDSGITLLRFKLAPELAYLMYNELGCGTYSYLFLRGKNDYRCGPIRVVCSCCKSHNSNLSREMLEQVCSENGIRVVFVRKAFSWEKSYGKSQNVKVVEASEAEEKMNLFYPASVVHSVRRLFVGRGV